MTALDAAPRRCALHPERDGIAACQRCGRFVCEEDRRVRDEIVHCPRCLAVDPLEAFRAKLWGRRDVWAWLMGLSALPQGWLTVEAVRGDQGVAWIAASVAMTVLCVCYFFGQRWARVGVLFSPLAVLVAPQAIFESQAPPGMDLTQLVWATKLTVVIVGSGLLVGMYLNVRNQLFFRVPPAPARLAEERADYLSNRVARWALGISLGGLLLPGLGAASLPMAITALYRIRANPDVAMPGRREALWAVGLSVVGIALFVAVRMALLAMSERILRGEPPL